MDFLLWLMLPFAVATGTAFLTWILMRDRMTIAVERERQLTREAQALLEAQKEAVEDRVRAAEERARRVSLEEILGGRYAHVPAHPRLMEPRLIE